MCLPFGTTFRFRQTFCRCYCYHKLRPQKNCCPFFGYHRRVCLKTYYGSAFRGYHERICVKKICGSSLGYHKRVCLNESCGFHRRVCSKTLCGFIWVPQTGLLDIILCFHLRATTNWFALKDIDSLFIGYYVRFLVKIFRQSIL